MLGPTKDCLAFFQQIWSDIQLKTLIGVIWGSSTSCCLLLLSEKNPKAFFFVIELLFFNQLLSAAAIWNYSVEPCWPLLAPISCCSLANGFVWFFCFDWTWSLALTSFGFFVFVCLWFLCFCCFICFNWSFRPTCFSGLGLFWLLPLLRLSLVLCDSEIVIQKVMMM